MALRTALKIVGLSATRYHSWIRAKRTGCELNDQSCCPRVNPSQLLPEELRTMREMVTSPDYRHVPIGVLAMLAQQLGKLFANPATWYRYVRELTVHRQENSRRPCKSARKFGLRMEIKVAT